jgi:hypothetical protein
MRIGLYAGKIGETIPNPILIGQTGTISASISSNARYVATLAQAFAGSLNV